MKIGHYSEEKDVELIRHVLAKYISQ